MLADLTILMAHGAEEAAKILENYKVYENKPPELIQEKQDPSIMQQVIEFQILSERYVYVFNICNLFYYLYR